ncbi:MAG: hypothetical protein GXO89_14315 [Chlorobi bacterium]|nr:hypothetical protein [Chlorobiota bacterium]
MTPLGVMTVVIVNVYGQKVAELPLLTEKTVWDTRHSKAGVVYYYRLEIDGKILSGKIVVQ